MRQKNNQTIADSIVFFVPAQERESQRHHTTGLYHHQYIKSNFEGGISKSRLFCCFWAAEGEIF